MIFEEFGRGIMIFAIVLTVTSADVGVVKSLGIFASVIYIICQLPLATPRANSLAFGLGVFEMKITLMHKIAAEKVGWLSGSIYMYAPTQLTFV